MKTILYQTDQTDSTEIELSSNKPVPQIIINADEVEQRTGMSTGADIVEIQIHDSTIKDSVCKFWLDVRIGKNGKPVLIVATNIGNGTEVKKVKGEWR